MKKLTWLGVLNFLILQWFFIRLTRCKERVVESIKDIHSYSLNMGMDFTPDKVVDYYWYSIQGIILPMTGWKNRFAYMGKPVFWRITKKYIIKEPKRK